MSVSSPEFEKTFTCGATSLADKQYYIVKQHTDGTMILGAAATDKIVGVLQNKPVVGAPALVRIGGTTKVIAGGAINPGAWVTTDNAGKAVATTTDKDVVLGKYLGTAAAAASDIIEVQVHIFTLSA
jgi:hypothetical protein